MFKCLNPGLFGVQAGPFETVQMATRHGYEGIDVNFASGNKALTEDGRAAALRNELEAAGLWTGAAGLLPGTVTAPDGEWDAALKSLSSLSRIACDAGFTRSTIVVLPFHEKLSFKQNFNLHVSRLQQVAPVLADYGIRLGLEYVSPETRRTPYPYTFVHDLKGMLELIESTKQPNIGLLLDSFHWYCADETPADIAELQSRQVIAVHVNDAPRGRTRRQQIAFERELPGSTGQIDLAGFLNALEELEYDGPVTCEPMNKALNAKPAEEALAAVKAAMDQVWLQPSSGKDNR
jgi:sugar phosphate isomerase/epimerase